MKESSKHGVISARDYRRFFPLNTFDMFSPEYDQPQSANTLRGWFEEAGRENIEVFRRGFYVGRGTKPDYATPREERSATHTLNR